MLSPENLLISNAETDISFVPLLNLAELYRRHKEAFDTAIEKQLTKATFIAGEEVETFCREYAHWIGPGNHALGVANGTDAITLAALSLGLPTGAEAILPAMSYVATLEAVLHAGFQVRLVDVLPGTWHMDPAALKNAIGPNTKLIVPVHLFGQMAPMDTISEIARQKGCLILEDAAQAHGARWKNHPVGFWGDIATYSFYPGKNLGAFGDGGAILSRQKHLIKECAVLANHGGLKKYVHEKIGYNSRLDSIQAAVLRVKLKWIDVWNDSRRKIALRYQEELSGLSGLELPVENKQARHVYHLYVILVERREDFMAYLKGQGIDCAIHYPKALHQHQACASFAFSQERFPQAERVANHGVSIPLCPMMTERQEERVVSVIRRYFG